MSNLDFVIEAKKGFSLVKSGTENNGGHTVTIIK
jgi:hypothetical protein